MRQGEGGGLSTVKADKDQFQVSLDVKQFKPEEISVSVKDRFVIVEGNNHFYPNLYVPFRYRQKFFLLKFIVSIS